MSPTSSVAPGARPSAFGLYVAAAVMLIAAASLWGWRAQRALLQERARPVGGSANALLARGLFADTMLSYTALTRTDSLVGPHRVKLVTRVEQAPGEQLITFLNGPTAGMETGYAQHWLWRKARNGKLEAYAELQDDATALARRHFLLMQANYDVAMTGSTRLEGRPVQIVEVKPRSTALKGPARRLYLDAKTGLALLVESFDHSMNPVSESKLSQVVFNPTVEPIAFPLPAAIKAASHGHWEAEEMGSGPAQMQAVAARAGFLPPQPTWLPPGFVLDGYGLHSCQHPPASPYAALTRYSDGLNTLTIFEMRRASSAARPNWASCDFGPGTMVTRDTDGGTFVALADLPSETLRRVLDSTKFVISPAPKR